MSALLPRLLALRPAGRLVAGLVRSFAASANCPPKEYNRTARGLVVGMYQKEAEVDKPRLTKGGIRFDEKTGGRLLELVSGAAISGFLGQQVTFTNMGQDIGCVTVVGLGRECEGFSVEESIDVDRESVRVAVALGVHRLERQNCTHIFVDGMEFPEQAAEAATLSLWKYQENIMPENQRATAKVEVYDCATDSDGWNIGLIKADAQNLVRRMCDAPANQMTPIQFAQATVEALCPLGINVEVRNLNWIESNGFNSFLAVARSSCEPPIMLELTYCKGMSDEKPIMLLGQGLTFNSGGICLKKPPGMLEYRACMAGGAMVVGALQAIASLALSMKINALIPLCENMPSGMALKPGDVVPAKNNKMICVHDSNEVGVLMLIDALMYGQTTFSPCQVVDVGTFTDEIETALSGACAGAYTPSCGLWSHLERASSLTGDRMWRMPLWEYYTKKVTHFEKVDTSNLGHGSSRGLACKTAAFMKEFVQTPEWLHLDVRGPGMLAKNNIYPYTVLDVMAGRPTRTLIQYLIQHSVEELSK